MNFVSWAFVALLRRRLRGPPHHRTAQDRVAVRGGAAAVEPGLLRLAHPDLPRACCSASAAVDYVAAIAIGRLAAGPARAAARLARRLAGREPGPAGLLQVRRLRACARPRRPRRGGAHRCACRSSRWSCRWGSASTPSRRCPTRSTSTAASWRRCGTSRASCSSSASSRSWWPGRSCGPASSCRRSRGRVACMRACSTTAPGSSCSASS